MHILSNQIELANASADGDLEVLEERVEAMYGVLASGPTVLSVDIVTEGAAKIHILLVMSADDDEPRADAEARAKALCDEAFEIAKINVEEESVSANANAHVREFALV